MVKMCKKDKDGEASTRAPRGKKSRSARRWSTAFLAVALGLAALGTSASYVASTQADEPRVWKGRFDATVATGTLDLERTDAEFVAANAADPDVTRPKMVYFRDESGELIRYHYAWLSPADRAEVDFALGLAVQVVVFGENAVSSTGAVTLDENGLITGMNLDVAWDAAPNAGTRKALTANGVEYAFRYCPAGTFTMGSPESEEGRFDGETQREVTLTRGFWTLETEVTQEMWQTVMGSNPSNFDSDVRNPVEMVSWEDAQEFIAKLNADGVAPEGFEFRLPTEAEWEYACRAGTSTPYFWGWRFDGDKANCNGNEPYGISTKGKYLERTTAVGSYAPNLWGLYDMHGNVWAWCADWYGDYASGSQTDPEGPKSGSGRVIRGGSWSRGAKYCRSAYRLDSAPTHRRAIYGFRLVLGPKSPQKSGSMKTEDVAGDVAGVVTLDGEPLAGATLYFTPTEGLTGASQSVGKTNEKGEYKLQTLLGGVGSVIPGDYVVTVDCIVEVETGGVKLNDDGEEVPETEEILLLPPRYLNGATSGLTATVVQGANTFNFELTTEAAPIAEEADPTEEAAPAEEEAPAA